ncbi:MAG TPA: outer membrane beta-barrel protein [Rubricoccaceae bacterium]|jgi:opacity protein-like surface antigen
MRLVSLALLGLLGLPSVAFAQRNPSLAEKGDLALVVGVSSLVDLSPVLGGIGVRYRLADRTVIGTSLGLNIGSEDTDDANRVSTRTSATLAVWNENHLGRRDGIVSPFVGAGATFGVQRFQSDFDGAPCDPAACPGTPGGYSQSETTLSVGVGALLGAEVRIARGVTLGAAYTLGIAVDRRESDRQNPFGPSESSTATFVRGGTGLTDLSLSVYF